VAEHADIAIVGAGAAGLMAAIQAGRRRTGERIVLVDGARTLGAKILVSGGGRCNVTHDVVDEGAFAGSTPAAVRRVLRRFGVEDTIAFFAELGVELKREKTGKLFPVSDRARTVLEALLRAVREAGVEVRHPFRVTSVCADADGFLLRAEQGSLRAARLVLATGGRSLPKSGSDGSGHGLAQSLGHTLTERVDPALVPLLLPAGHPLLALSGVATPVRLEVRASSGRRLVCFEGPMLLTHFGLSGPVLLDVSRHWIAAVAEDPGARLLVDWLPGEGDVDRALQGRAAAAACDWLAVRLPTRLAEVLVRLAGLDPSRRAGDVSRAQRRALVGVLKRMALPVQGPRGWTWAEVTAGGVPLRELHLDRLASRVCPGLFLCGEMLDVDGRIGGFNFQWAWASGAVVGRAL
jgi:hypothetical protein